MDIRDIPEIRSIPIGPELDRYTNHFLFGKALDEDAPRWSMSSDLACKLEDACQRHPQLGLAFTVGFASTGGRTIEFQPCTIPPRDDTYESPSPGEWCRAALLALFDRARDGERTER